MKWKILSLAAVLVAATTSHAQTPEVIREVKSLLPPDTPPLTSSGSPTAQPGAGTVEEAIAIAFRQHPDVKVAEAKRNVADAELAQARLFVAQKVVTAFSKQQATKAVVERAEKRLADHMEPPKGNPENKPGRLTVERELLEAIRNLQTANAELLTLQGSLVNDASSKSGDPNRVTTITINPGTTAEAPPAISSTFMQPPAKPADDLVAKFGTVGEKLRTLIDKKLAIDQGAASPADLLEALVQATGERGIVIRLPGLPANAAEPKVGPLKGEQTFLAWVQLVMDDLAAYSSVPEKVTEEPSSPGGGAPGGGFGRGQRVEYRNRPKYEVYVRDYGLLVTTVNAAPPGAVTLAEFAKQVHAEKNSLAPKKP